MRDDHPAIYDEAFQMLRPQLYSVEGQCHHDLRRGVCVPGIPCINFSDEDGKEFEAATLIKFL